MGADASSTEHREPIVGAVARGSGSRGVPWCVVVEVLPARAARLRAVRLDSAAVRVAVPVGPGVGGAPAIGRGPPRVHLEGRVPPALRHLCDGVLKSGLAVEGHSWVRVWSGCGGRRWRRSPPSCCCSARHLTSSAQRWQAAACVGSNATSGRCANRRSSHHTMRPPQSNIPMPAPRTRWRRRAVLRMAPREAPPLDDPAPGAARFRAGWLLRPS